MNAAPNDAHPTRLTLSAGPTRTDVVIGRGLLARGADLLSAQRGTRLLLVADTHVAPLYALPLGDTLTQAGYAASVLTIPAGEPAKTLATLIDLYTACQGLQVERGDMVIAVGGGVVGDVAGMLAGTYLRGLEFAQVPTSLVAQVSASIGGKVGVNFGGAKNQIGLFNQPTLVLIDLDTLDTLPKLEFQSGLGELITVGVLGAPALFEALEAHGTADLGALIIAAIQCKSAIVEADPFDRLGGRARLNLGHTFGHALEQLSDFALPHGLAVAVGLHIASRLASALGLCAPALADRIEHTLLALDLPVALTGYAPEQMLQAMRSDKKRSGGRLRLVLPQALGQVILVDEREVPAALLEELLRAMVWAGAGWRAFTSHGA
jgi:3-dehydroquinate synthase